MTTDDLEARLKVVARCAPDLRKAGVVGRVTIGDVEFELAEHEPEVPKDQTTTPEHPDDLLRDPDTYGGELPRRRGDPSDEDEAPWPSPIVGGKPPRARRTS